MAAAIQTGRRLVSCQASRISRFSQYLATETIGKTISSVRHPFWGMRCWRSRPLSGFASSSSSENEDDVDLRSDTVTKPCQQLRAAMSAAVVGDDVHGEDPTVSKLEEYVAMLLGKEEGLLVPRVHMGSRPISTVTVVNTLSLSLPESDLLREEPSFAPIPRGQKGLYAVPVGNFIHVDTISSGTMGNLIAVGVHCRRGDEIILGDHSHMFFYESGNASAFMGVSYNTVPNLPDGGLNLEDIRGAIREDDVHYARSSLLCVENTHNKRGGRAISAERMAEMSEVAREAGLKVHLDGARLWNAAVALGTRPRDLAAHVDSASVCLSKGLGAPVGSVLVGSSEFVYQARRLRKALGGGMRQAGVIAAAGLEAVINNYLRLQEDHDNAKFLAKGLAATPGIRADRVSSDTNAVYFQLQDMDPDEFLYSLQRDHKVLMGGGYFGSTIRAMTHKDVNRRDVERALEACRIVLEGGQR